MISSKSVACWQEPKAEKLGGRTVPEDMEYKKLQMKRNVDVLALNELKWKAELAEAILTLASSNGDLAQRLNGVIDSQTGGDQGPFVKKNLCDFVAVFVVKIKQEQQEQNHARSLRKNPLYSNEFPNGNNPD